MSFRTTQSTGQQKTTGVQQGQLEPKLQQARNATLYGPGGARFVEHLTEGTDSSAKLKKLYLESDIKDPSKFLEQFIDDLGEKLQNIPTGVHEVQRGEPDAMTLVLEKFEARELKRQVDEANKFWKAERQIMEQQVAILQSSLKTYENIIDVFINARGTYEDINSTGKNAQEKGGVLIGYVQQYSKEINLGKLKNDIRKLKMIVSDDRLQGSQGPKIKKNLEEALKLLKRVEMLLTEVPESDAPNWMKSQIILDTNVEALLAGVLSGNENTVSVNFLEELGLTAMFNEGSPTKKLIEIADRVEELGRKFAKATHGNLQQGLLVEQIQKQIKVVGANCWQIAFQSWISGIIERMNNWISSLFEGGNENS